MERVEKGETYWCILNFPYISVENLKDLRWSCHDADFECGNYFRTKEEAETMANKLRAVLNGAEVIEIPDMDEIIDEAERRYPPHMREGNMQDSRCEIFSEGVDWLKSKIVK